MLSRLLQLPLALLLALGVASGAAAQSTRHDQTVLPVWNNASGKVEALLVLEPVEGAQAGARWRFGNNTLDATLGLDAGDSLALLCDRKNGLAGTLGNLSNNCLLAALGNGLDAKATTSRWSPARASAARAMCRSPAPWRRPAWSPPRTCRTWPTAGTVAA
jgi:hypothetical protein